ncbi:nucleotidyltransferase [Caldinitratiruptor microaerophilus]|uniref:Nucleotidyltransferase family protein n=1 Tax=Caldinitratiruptor microaerophilus TaxID=671077 RepID=A0AA35CIS5_9FIRM|nr:nucleotidyltransferase [Caldinitratiruptor microaerophilus]BDG59797.1 hypothetical protein caldi_08870 [Caldinitratiruptor microaerophilus]
MNSGTPPSPVRAALEIASYLEARGVPYVIIGGLAVQHWGEPRATRDVDVTVMVSAESVDAFLEEVTRRFRPRIADAVDFARRSRVLLLQSSEGVPIDLSLGVPGYEEEVMRRAVTVTWPGGKSIRLVGCEDLIIHKCVAGRARDLEDVRSILRRQQGRVDLEYIRLWLKEFAELVPEHDVLRAFEDSLSSLE